MGIVIQILTWRRRLLVIPSGDLFGLGKGEEKREKKVMESLRAHFRPEFLNRIDETIIFDRLDKEELREIVGVQLERVRQRLAKQGIDLSLSDEVVQFIADRGYDPVYGARPLKRAIQTYLLDPLSLEVLKGEFKDGDVIKTDLKNDQIVFFV